MCISWVGLILADTGGPLALGDIEVKHVSAMIELSDLSYRILMGDHV